MTSPAIASALPMPATAEPRGSGSELRWAVWALRREFAAVGLYSMATNLLMLAPTLYMLQVYDHVLVSRNELTLAAVSLLTLLLFIMAAVVEKSRAAWLVRIGARLDAALNARVLSASIRAALSPAGDAPSRPLADLTELRQFLTGAGAFAFFDSPWVPVYVAVLFFLHPVLGGLALAFALVQALLAWLGHHRAAALAKASASELRHANAHLQNHFQEAEVVESMGMLANLLACWQQWHQRYMARHAVAQMSAHRIAAWSKFVRYSQQSLALGMGALLVIDGSLSPGAMIAANVLMSRALAPIDMLVSSWHAWVGARDAFGRLESLLQKHAAEESAPSQTQMHVPLEQLSHVLELQSVTAHAAGREAPILQGVSMKAEPGTVTAVTGPSGAGKSTLARVMLGVWPQLQGDALLMGQPFARWSQSALGATVGYLPQDVELLGGTVAENISRFAELDSAKVIAAARSAGVHDMILRLPKGYDTFIGDGGYMLSGGQTQRVGLARALYGNPALVVLDEPNANLDEAGELALMAAVRELKSRGAAVVLISHRPGVLALADQVLALRGGQVQYCGPVRQASVFPLSPGGVHAPPATAPGI